MESENLSKLTINYLTEAEYERAKANGELKDDELYMTPDDNGFSSVEKYSTDEVKTNKIWIDGRPIYRRVTAVEVTTQSSTHKEYNLNVSSTYTIVSTQMQVVGTGGTADFAWFDKSAIDMYAYKGNPNWILAFVPKIADILNTTIYIILEYVKPTDEKTDDVIQQFSSNLVYEKTLSEATKEIIINGLDLVADGGTYEVLLETNNTSGLTWICFQINGKTDNLFTNKKVVHNSVGEFVMESDASIAYGVIGASSSGSIQALCKSTISINNNTLNAISESNIPSPSNQYFTTSGAYNNTTPIDNVTTLKIFNQNNANFSVGTKVKVFKKTAISLNTIMKQDEVYDTAEHKIGTFLGKPLYRRTFDGRLNVITPLMTKANLQYETITDIRGFIYSKYDQWWKIGTYHKETNYFNAPYWTNSGITLDCGTNYNADAMIKITIEYTKTTD